MARFPFEEDTRFRFGAFHELVRRYIFIGREAPADRRPQAKAAVDRRSTLAGRAEPSAHAPPRARSRRLPRLRQPGSSAMSVHPIATAHPRLRAPAGKGTLDRIAARMAAARSNHMGYPYNLAFGADDLARFGGYLINNLGDPYAGSHYGAEVCDLEREAVAWFERLWECDGDGFWGSVGASGTEGNLWALYLGREAMPGAVLLHSDDAHYSIPKAGRILGMETRAVRASADGAILLSDLDKGLASLGGRPVVLALTCGTTMKGAHDDIAGAIHALDAAGYGPDRRFVHVDGALNAMVVPFVGSAPTSDPPVVPDGDRQHLDLRSQDGGHADALRRAGRAAAACRARRFGGELPPLERYDADGLAERPCRARHLESRHPARRQGLHRRRRRLPGPGRMAGGGAPDDDGARCSATRCR